MNIAFIALTIFLMILMLPLIALGILAGIFAMKDIALFLVQPYKEIFQMIKQKVRRKR